jgi:3-deoxy-7-phosphoheptulonate synthase
MRAVAEADGCADRHPNPKDEAGRRTLICRSGVDKIEKHLPKLIRAVQTAGRAVVWECDPMHGNTVTAATGYKTRPFASIVGEVERFLDIHRAEGTYPGGVHIEMTGQNVTECRAARSIRKPTSPANTTRAAPRLMRAKRSSWLFCWPKG